MLDRAIRRYAKWLFEKTKEKPDENLWKDYLEFLGKKSSPEAMAYYRSVNKSEFCHAMIIEKLYLEIEILKKRVNELENPR